jgi:hypothetical protein
VKFLIELWSTKFGCIVDQVEVTAPSTQALGHLLGLDDFDELHGYELDVADLLALEPLTPKSLVGLDLKAVLRSCYWLDDLPYKIHTNRELCMMLDGIKPLAVFSGAHGVEEDDGIPEKYFRPYVDAGKFIFREIIIPSRKENLPGIRYALYAMPEHQWRIEAYALMLHTAEIEGWNNALERMEGSLLGYEDWQNDEFMVQREIQSHRES